MKKRHAVGGQKVDRNGIGYRDFSAKTVRGLAKAGIRIIGITNLPGDGPMPYANGIRGYLLDNNGTHQVREHAQVVAMASR